MWKKISGFFAELLNDGEPLAIISDIHGNIEALEAVLSEINKRDVERIVCLGDIVGYGASPSECLERLGGIVEICVMGNHDQALFDPDLLDRFNANARAAVEWSRTQLSRSQRKCLKNLPHSARIDSVTLVHANLEDPSSFRYILKEKDAARNFGFLSDPIAIFGHSHRPVIFAWDDGEVKTLDSTKVSLDEKKRYLVNPGSVGQPRDGDPRASFAVYYPAVNEVEILRVEYPVAAAREKILAAGLPAALGDRLLRGK